MPSARATASTWTPPPGRSCSRRARRSASCARSPPPTSPEVAPTPSAADELPLAGYTILDLTRVLAGPYCTRLLCDLGARVIKIERPGDGDETRRNYLQLEPGRADQSSYFHRVNAGKESVAVDMAHPEGRAISHDLARPAPGRLHAGGARRRRQRHLCRGPERRTGARQPASGHGGGRHRGPEPRHAVRGLRRALAAHARPHGAARAGSRSALRQHREAAGGAARAARGRDPPPRAPPP